MDAGEMRKCDLAWKVREVMREKIAILRFFELKMAIEASEMVERVSREVWCLG